MKTSNLLSLFNLSTNEQEVYLILNKTPWLTVLELSKKTTIKRTTLYRILDSLLEKGLIEMQVDDKTTHYATGSINSFKSLITEQEQKTKKMKSGLESLVSQLSLLQKPNLLATKVRFYRGKRGMQSMEWKICSEKNTETLIFGSDKWRFVVGEDLAEEIRQEHINNNIKIKEILNPNNISPILENNKITWTKNTNYALNYYFHRSISRKILDLQTEIIINHQSVFILSFQEDEKVGIELVSPTLAKSLRQLFKIVWNQAKIIDDLGGTNFNLNF